MFTVIRRNNRKVIIEKINFDTIEEAAKYVILTAKTYVDQIDSMDIFETKENGDIVRFVC